MACIVDWSFVSKTLLDLRPKPDDSNICKKTTDFSENPSKIKDFRKSNSGFHQKLQILIESHSEHLLTRLQLGIAKKKIPVDDTVLYFCENENGVSSIKPLDIDELGNIKNWPKDFFGDVRGDLVKMKREQMKHQKKEDD